MRLSLGRIVRELRGCAVIGRSEFDDSRRLPLPYAHRDEAVPADDDFHFGSCESVLVRASSVSHELHDEGSRWVLPRRAPTGVSSFRTDGSVLREERGAAVQWGI